VWRGGRGDERGAGDIGGEQLRPLFRGHLAQRSQHAHPGRVHQGVEAAERADHLGHRLLATGCHGDVAGDGHRTVAGVLGGVDQLVVTTCQQSDVGTPLGKPGADAPPETRGGADDCDA
jgi:hypothetical protein